MYIKNWNHKRLEQRRKSKLLNIFYNENICINSKFIHFENSFEKNHQKLILQITDLGDWQNNKFSFHKKNLIKFSTEINNNLDVVIGKLDLLKNQQKTSRHNMFVNLQDNIQSYILLNEEKKRNVIIDSFHNSINHFNGFIDLLNINHKNQLLLLNESIKKCQKNDILEKDKLDGIYQKIYSITNNNQGKQIIQMNQNQNQNFIQVY
jgi:hypothetical protein